MSSEKRHMTEDENYQTKKNQNARIKWNLQVFGNIRSGNDWKKN